MFSALIRQTQTRLSSSCSVCRVWGKESICSDCLQAFAQPRKRCTTCALPMPQPTAGIAADELSDADQALALRCGACLTLGSSLEACYAAVDYAYPWDALIARFKYSDGGDLSAQPALASSMAAVIKHVAMHSSFLAQGLQEASRSDWIIPVALHPDRQHERGFNQALALARAIFPAHPRIRSDLLLRIQNTAVQADLPRDARAGNLRGAFIAEPLKAAQLAGTHVTLIDDVTTTTATLSAAAQALRSAGVRRVNALVFARTV
jgi:ComF family protein